MIIIIERQVILYFAHQKYILSALLDSSFPPVLSYGWLSWTAFMCVLALASLEFTNEEQQQEIVGSEGADDVGVLIPLGPSPSSYVSVSVLLLCG